MALKKIKISELLEATTLKGLWTIGVNAANQSVKVGLEFLQTQYEKMVTATNACVTATKEAVAATKEALTQAGRAQQHADNPPKMGENGNWWCWNEASQKYIDTGVLAKGGVLYPTFDIVQEDDLNIYMDYQDEIAADMFEVEDGVFYFNDKYGV